MQALHSFLPKNDHCCFIFLPKTTARLHFTKIKVYLCSSLSYSLAFPNIIALNAVHWCSQWEFPGNAEGAINPHLSTCTALCYEGDGYVSAFCREATEEQQDSGQQLGDMLLRQWVNLLMRLAHRGEKRRATARITEKSLHQEKPFTGMLLRTTKKYKRAVFCRWTG